MLYSVSGYMCRIKPWNSDLWVAPKNVLKITLALISDRNLGRTPISGDTVHHCATRKTKTVVLATNGDRVLPKEISP